MKEGMGRDCRERGKEELKEGTFGVFDFLVLKYTVR